MRLPTVVLVALVAGCARTTEPAEKAAPKAGAALRAAFLGTLQREAGVEYAVSKAMRARNPGHGLTIDFDHQGALVSGTAGVAAWSAKVALAGYGCRDAVEAVPPARIFAAANRVDYRRPAAAGFDEWYLNGPLGLEFGYTLTKSPGCPEVTFEVGLEGVELSTEGDQVTLRRGGELVAWVGETVALDATGRALPAGLEVVRGRLQVQVSLAGAVFPVAIDPLLSTETQRVAPVIDDASDFGRAVAIDGDTVAFGAPAALHSVAAASQCCGTSVCQTGAVWVYVRGAAGWSLQARLERPVGQAYHQERFGSALALSGNTLVVGAYQADANVPTGTPGTCFVGNGAAFVFTRSGTTWYQTAKLVASDGALADQFGYSVAIDGTTVVVGAPNDEPGASSADDRGAAYVFVYSGSAWAEQARLVAGDARAGDWFGSSVAVSGDTAIVGAPTDSASQTRPGFAYAFVRTGATWSEQAQLVASDSLTDDEYGCAVSISGDTAVVGAKLHDQGGANSGAAYVFTRSGVNWLEQQELFASDAGAGDLFGHSVTIEGERLVVGASAVRRGPALSDLDPWANVHSAGPGNSVGTVTTGPFAVAPGQDRLLVVSAAIELDAAGTLGAPAATFGGAAMVTAATTRARSAREHVHLFYLRDAAIPSGPQPLTVSYSAGARVVTGVHVNWASYQGVAQAAPIYSSANNASAAAPSVTFGTAVNYLGSGVTLFAAANGGTPATMTPPAGFTGQLGVTTAGHSSFAGASGLHASTGSHVAGTSVAFTGTTTNDSAVVVGSLRPSVNHGAAYASIRRGTVWTELTTLGSTTPIPAAALGTSVGLSRGRVVAGAPREQQGAVSQPGAGYFFTLPGVACGAPSDCPTGLTCVDGVCCQSACGQPCQRCNQVNAEGLCLAVLGADDPGTCEGTRACDAVGACLTKQGFACAGSDGECASNHCVDGLCCNSACTGTCESCAVSTLEGTCVPLAAGTDPDDECGSGTCAGVCDGASACAYPGSATTCAAASCTGSTLTLADTCNGAGVCADRGTSACPGWLKCDAGGSACLTACAQNQDCVTGYRCDSFGACQPSLALGAPCNQGLDCASGWCADGVCCGSACGGLCQRCDLATHLGACWPIADGQDPEDECAGLGPCGGVCDGASACRFPDGTSTCVAASCSAGIASPARTCDGAGACSTVASASCGPYVCQGTACGTSCNADLDCAPGSACDVVAHQCKKAPGVGCGGPGECASGVCAGGRCCAGACAHADATCGGSCDSAGACSYPTTATSCGTCRVCDGSGLCLGTPTDDASCPAADCSSLSTPCATYGAISTNRCAAFGQCKAAPADCVPTSVAASGTACGPVSCTAGSQTRHLCDGAGVCETSSAACAPYACGSGSCLTSCQTTADCQPGLACSVATGSCRGANGDACSANAQCASGQCVDGVCCESACSGVCERCDLAASRGACSPVAAGQDPDEECRGTGTCGGTCDGQRVCAFPASSTSCGLCVACDSLGACAAQPADDPSCGSIACSALSTSCRAYTDLVANRCAAVGACLQPSLLSCTSYVDAPNATPCTCAGGASGACASGTCECAASPDAGAADAGTLDAGTPDAGALDAGTLDAGTLDAGTLDAGTLDAGALDAGTPDAGALDAGAPDAGALDAGALDAGALDAGALDAGALDAGALDAGAPGDGEGSPPGCGCGSTRATSGLMPVLLGLAVIARRRRR